MVNHRDPSRGEAPRSNLLIVLLHAQEPKRVCCRRELSSSSRSVFFLSSAAIFYSGLLFLVFVRLSSRVWALEPPLCCCATGVILSSSADTTLLQQLWYRKNESSRSVWVRAISLVDVSTSSGCSFCAAATCIEQWTRGRRATWCGRVRCPRSSRAAWLRLLERLAR